MLIALGPDPICVTQKKSFVWHPEAGRGVSEVGPVGNGSIIEYYSGSLTDEKLYFGGARFKMYSGSITQVIGEVILNWMNRLPKKDTDTVKSAVWKAPARIRAVLHAKDGRYMPGPEMNKLEKLRKEQKDNV